MCLGVPGKILQITRESHGLTMGRVQFGGILKEVCLSFLPEARVGEYVIVHAGFAISLVDEAEAASTLQLLELRGEVDAIR